MTIDRPSDATPRPDKSVLDAIGRFREAGFALHWLQARTKKPVANGWSEAPVATLDELRRTHAPGLNLGVRPGEPSALATGGYLHILDIDIRLPEVAEDAWEAARALFPDIDLDTLPTVVSGSEGESRHSYLIIDRPFTSKKLATSGEKFRGADGKWHFTWEIELYGTGKQIAMPPSIHPDTGKPYRWLRPFDFDMLALGIGPFVPASAIEALAVAETSTYAFESRDPLTFEPGQMERDLADIPDAHLDDYNDWVTLGQALHHQFGGSEEGLAIWIEQSRRSQKFDGSHQGQREMRGKWRGFGRNRRQPVTMGTIRQWAIDARRKRLLDQFDEVDAFDDGGACESAGTSGDTDPLDLLGDPAPAADDPLDLLGTPSTPAALADGNPAKPEHYLKRLNRKHAVVMVRGRALIATELRDGTVDFGTVTDLKTFYANDLVPNGSGDKLESVGPKWLRHPKRRSYEGGVVFAPGGAPENALNLWRGWAIRPDPQGSCELFLRHVREVVCRGDADHFAYVVGWMAHLVQRPDEKPGVALVLRGEKGAGKDTVAEYLSRIIGRRHVPTVAETEHIVGRFNARLENALLLHIQEGSWAGDRKAEGVLKYLVTSDVIEIERKGIDSIRLPSVLRMFISANAEWVVPASKDERRWAVFNVSPARAGDLPYFAALRREMEGRGPAALLNFLRSYDISTFNVRTPPDTDGLRDQKVESLRNIQLWWLGILTNGDLPGASGFDGEPDWAAEGRSVPREILRANYSDWMRGRRYDGEILEERHFGRELREMLPSVGDKRANNGGVRAWNYTFPPLSECRVAFEGWLRSPMEWE